MSLTSFARTSYRPYQSQIHAEPLRLSGKPLATAGIKQNFSYVQSIARHTQFWEES